jgi:hypothetical protein
MNDHPARAENVARPRGAEPNRYAITLAALLATAQVPGSRPGRGTTPGATS